MSANDDQICAPLPRFVDDLLAGTAFSYDSFRRNAEFC